MAEHYWDPVLPAGIQVVQHLEHVADDDFGPVLSPLRAMAIFGSSAPTIGQAPFPNRITLHIKATSLLWLLAELLQKERRVR